MKQNLLIMLVCVCLLNACQGQPPPQIRFGELSNADNRMQLSNAISKALISNAFGNDVVIIYTSDLLNDLLSEKVDVALFIETPEAQGIPARCSQVSNEAITLGPLTGSSHQGKVARCDLTKKDKRVFDLIEKMTFSTSALDDALSWKALNNASLTQAAFYYLNYNSTGAFGFTKWLSEGSAQNVKTAIANEMQRSKIPY